MAADRISLQQNAFSNLFEDYQRKMHVFPKSSNDQRHANEINMIVDVDV